MSDSDSSSLSDPLPSDDEKLKKPPKPTLKLVNGKLGGFAHKKASPQSSPEPPQTDLGREASPPHEYVLADNPDIALIVMFRSRFDAVFQKPVPHLGPQDIEAGIVSTEPSENVENLLCGLLGLCLNRKKNPERGHFNRALEECLSSHKSQWPRSWAGKNPIAGNREFNSFSPTEKLDLLKVLTHWALASSEAVNAIIKESYKQSRKDDDVNQPLSVQPWGYDTRKRKFYLVEGQVDAPFRIYRESERKASAYSWISVAGTIEEAQRLARDLRAEKAQAAHRLAARITNAVPLLEEREEKRRRREYRKAQKERFVRPEPGFSLYEGRTRGKRMRYTYDDEDVYGTDENRRSSRNSRTATPAEGPTYTASGRQVRSLHGKTYGDRHPGMGSSTRASSQGDEEDELSGAATRSGRSRRTRDGDTYDGDRYRSGLGRNHVDEFDEESDPEPSGEEWAGNDQDFEGKMDDEQEDADVSSDEGSEDELGLDGTPRSLIVKLRCGDKLQSQLKAEATPSDAENDKMDIDKPEHENKAMQQPTNGVDASTTQLQQHQREQKGFETQDLATTTINGNATANGSLVPQFKQEHPHPAHTYHTQEPKSILSESKMPLPHGQAPSQVSPSTSYPLRPDHTGPFAASQAQNQTSFGLPRSDFHVNGDYVTAREG